MYNQGKMKNILFTILLIACCNYSGFSKMQVFFQSSFFNIPGQGPYIETYLTTIGESVVFTKNTNGKFQASVQITILFKQEGQIKTFKKYNLLSPEIDDTLKTLPNFVDQQRIPVPAGVYNFELIVADNNNPKEDYSFKDIITIDFPSEEISFSGIQLLEKFETSAKETVLTKNGYDLYPYVANFYPENLNKLIFYTEIYNTDKVLKNEDFLIRYSIEYYASGKPIGEFSRFKKSKPSTVNILLSEFNIEKLKSGNYNLAIEIINKENKVLKSKKVFFQRSNIMNQQDSIDYATGDINNTFAASIINKDTIKEYIKALRPISNEAEKRFTANILKKDSLQYMQQFFYNFWQSRNFANPQEEWNKYKQQLDLVNRLYKTPIEKGYETDRGRVYLQYGSPNEIVENKFEAGQYPNEIWHYYSIKGQNNIKFIFYNPDLTTNVFHLIHSDLIGEIQEKSWENIINRDRIRVRENQKSDDNMRGNEHFSGGKKK